MANTGQGSETSLSQGAEAPWTQVLKRPVWPKQTPGTLNIPESNPHPMPSSLPQHLTQSAGLPWIHPVTGRSLPPAPRSEPIPALVDTQVCPAAD